MESGRETCRTHSVIVFAQIIGVASLDWQAKLVHMFELACLQAI